MGGQPWSELELHGRSWESLPERGERGRGGAAGGTVGGGHGEGLLLEEGTCSLLILAVVLCSFLVPA
jgi:hypothetical protein